MKNSYLLTLVSLVLLFTSCNIDKQGENIDTKLSECNSSLLDSLLKNPSDSSISILLSLDYEEVNLDCEYLRLQALAENYSYFGLLDSADKWSLSGISLAKHNKDSIKIIDFLVKHASVKANKMQSDIAIDLLHQALEIEKNIEYPAAHTIYDRIAMCYYMQKDYNSSKIFFEKSVDLIIEKGNVDSLQYYKINAKRAFYFSNEQKYDSAIIATSKAISYLHPQNHVFLAQAYQSLAGDYNLSGNRQKAHEYFDKSLECHKRANLPTIELKYNLGIIYKHEKNYVEAERYFQESYEEATKLNNQKYILQNLGLLLGINQEIGNYKKALDYFLIANKINTKFDSAHKEEQLEEFKVKYDVSLKEEQNKSLLLENEITKSESKSRTIILALVIFILLLLGGVAFLRFRQFSFKRKLEQVQLEQKLLRSQMNPHFIFNSISNIHSLIIANENKDAAKYLSKFSKLLRLMLENSREQFVEIEHEILALENYMELQQMRFKDQFDFNFNVHKDIETDTIKIPPMVIQPFIENAIEHGIRNIGYKGFIKIDLAFAEYPNTLICIIEDNGVGLSKSSGNKNPQKGKSLSTQITNERLEILAKRYHSKAELKVIEKDKESGTIVKILIPYIV